MLSDIEGLVTDFNRQLSEYISEVEYEPSILEQTETRLNRINALKARYGSTIQDILSRLEELKQQEELLSSYDETKEKHFKAHGFDLIIPGGTLTSRSRGKNQVCPNGECCIDVDHISFALRESLFQNLIDDPELTVDLMFRSPRGHGLKIFLRYDPDEISYKDFYLSASNYLLFNYGVMADKACSDITHPCLIPWDDNAFINKETL
jgi:hypothetical protein